MAHEPRTVSGECIVCYEDMTPTTYVEYQVKPTSEWKLCLVCVNCVEDLRMKQFKIYCDNLKNTKCAAEQRRLLTSGPPINIKDKNIFLTGDEDVEIYKLYYASDGGKEISGKLEGSLEGEERLAWWEEQKKFKIIDEKDHELHDGK